MADANITKNARAGALKQLVAEKPFEKISVGEICDLCQMNRKSFYYHFHDKYELVVWIFENEFIRSTSHYTFGDLWGSVSAVCSYFYSNKTFYKKILLINGQNCFTEYFSTLCKRGFVERMRERLLGITVTDRNVILYANFFVYSVYTWITGPDQRSDVEFVKDLKNSVIFGAELAKAFSQRDDKQISSHEIDHKTREIVNNGL